MLAPIRGAPAGAPMPPFPGSAPDQPASAPPATLRPAAPAEASVYWSSRYGTLRLIPIPIPGFGDTLFVFERLGFHDFKILLSGVRASFIKALRIAAPVGWDTAEPTAFARSDGAMALIGDPTFSYLLSVTFSFALIGGETIEDRRGVTIRITRKEPSATGRKTSATHEIIEMQIVRPDLIRLFDALAK